MCVFSLFSLCTANSIKVELCSDDESPGAPQPENREAVSDDNRKDDRGDPMEEGSAEYSTAARERASVYNDMASPNAASPGPIRLPNGKLQCEVCGMICIGPNVLMVHKRSHTGERKPDENTLWIKCVITLNSRFKIHFISHMWEICLGLLTYAAAIKNTHNII